jgi:hypothetical protein
MRSLGWPDYDDDYGNSTTWYVTKGLSEFFCR